MDGLAERDQPTSLMIIEGGKLANLEWTAHSNLASHTPKNMLKTYIRRYGDAQRHGAHIVVTTFYHKYLVREHKSGSYTHRDDL